MVPPTKDHKKLTINTLRVPERDIEIVNRWNVNSNIKKNNPW